MQIDLMNLGKSPNYKRELEIIRMAKHENIVRYYYHDQDEDFFYIVMELCRCSLFNYFRENGYDLMRNRTILFRILFHTTTAVEYLHGHSILHRDIKPHNILLHQNGENVVAKLTDFGIGKMLDPEKSTTCSKIKGTGGYNPCEVLHGLSNRAQSDIFSLGIVYHELANQGKHPFGDHAVDREFKIKNRKAPVQFTVKFDLEISFISDEDESDFEMLIRRMIVHDWSRRPSIKDVVCDMTKIYCGAGYPGIPWWDEDRNDSCIWYLRSPVKSSEFGWELTASISDPSATASCSQETDNEGSWSELSPRKKRMKLVACEQDFEACLHAYAVGGPVMTIHEWDSETTSPEIQLQAAEYLVTINYDEEARDSLKQAIRLLRRMNYVGGNQLLEMAQESAQKAMNFRSILFLACAVAKIKENLKAQDASFETSKYVYRIFQQAAFMIKDTSIEEPFLGRFKSITEKFVIPLMLNMVEELDCLKEDVCPILTAKNQAFAFSWVAVLLLGLKKYEKATKIAEKGRIFLQNALTVPQCSGLETYTRLLQALGVASKQQGDCKKAKMLLKEALISAEKGNQRDAMRFIRRRLEETEFPASF